MKHCQLCGHVVLHTAIECAVCLNRSLTDSSAITLASPQNLLAPAEHEKGFVPKIRIAHDKNKKTTAISFSSLKNKHLECGWLDIYLETMFIGRISRPVIQSENAFVHFHIPQAKRSPVILVLPGAERLFYWRITYPC